MESLRKQAAKLLGEQKKYKRWLAVFLCLALLVTTSTIAALKLNGQAQNYEKEVLECALEVHEHTAECYAASGETVSGGDAGQLLCGYADYVVHAHNDNCYDKDGELVCQLSETKAHVHGEGCYEERKILVCGLEETELEEAELHVHTEECRRLICQLDDGEEPEAQTEGAGEADRWAETEKTEGHVHTEECRNLICGLEEGADAGAEKTEEDAGHVHTDECRALVCGKKESQGHVHADACSVLICMQEESQGHIHTDACRILICTQEESQGHVHHDACRRLTCEQEENPGHAHTGACTIKVQGDLACVNEEEGHQHADECYVWTEEIGCGLEEGAGSHVHTDECYNAYGCGLEEGAEGHVHTDQCYDAHGCGLEEGAGSHVHTDQCYDAYACGLKEGAAQESESAEAEETHVHTDECYEGYSCGLEEGAAQESESAEAEEAHVHTDECYDGYVCGLEEGGLADPENGHVHADGCYAAEKVLVCGQLALHTHGDGCRNGEGNLICGIPELREHVHGGECIQIVELTKEEIEAIQKEEKGGKDAEDVKTEHALYQKVYEDGSVKVVAEFDEKANIPAEAEMYAEIVPKTEDAASGGEGTEEGEGTEASEGTDAPAPSEENGANAEPESEANADGDDQEAQTDGTDLETEKEEPEADAPVKGENDARSADTEGDAVDGEIAKKILQGKGRMEIVEEEVTYRIVFRLNGEEIRPEGQVTLTIWDLEDEESQPEEKIYAADSGVDQMMFSLTRKVEVFVQTEFQKVYEDANIRVIAEYNKSAEIPEEAELWVYEITPESDPQRFADCEEKFKEAVEDENAEMSTLLEIGFYVDNEEIEPKDVVTMMVQFLDGEGRPIGDPINVVHFAEDKTEVLEDGGTGEEGFVTFKTESFSPFAFYNAVGATMGFGLKNAGANTIPLFVLQDGVWTELRQEFGDFYSFQGIEKNEYSIKYEDGKCQVNLFGPAPLMNFIYQAIYYHDNLYNPDAWTEASNEYKRVGISYIASDNIEYITTATVKYENWRFENGASAQISVWVSEINIPSDSVTGIYYLAGNNEGKNAESLNKALQDFLSGDDSINFSTVIFNPGNANGKNPHRQYGGENIFRTELKMGKRANEQEGAADSSLISIFLPSDNDLGKEFVLCEREDASEENTNLRIKVKNASSGEFEDINEDNKIIVSDHSSEYDNGYRLVGWYDIETKEYWDVSNGGREVQIDLKRNHIFYADWVAESYDFYRDDKDKNNIIETESTSDFITTRVFDYNELFNVYSAWYSTAEGGETWVDSGSFVAEDGTRVADSMLFWEGERDKGNNVSGSLGSASMTKDWNGAVQGLYTRWAGTPKIFEYLFPENGADRLGVHYLGTGDYLFKHVGNEGGKVGSYVYDSRYNAASYQQSENRFYVYEDPQNAPIDGTGFFPLNNSENMGSEVSINGKINYFFGMSCEINFYLPANTKSSEGKGNQIDGKNMRFSFSGDDDVWVFIESAKEGPRQLVLDLSGIHGRKEGYIDFSEGAVYTEGAKSADLNLEKGSYKMTVYYLERGAGGSNCMIDFNIVPQYKIESAIADTMEATKEWLIPENAKDKAIVPENIELTLYKKADLNAWQKETGTDEKKEELRKKLNLSEDDFQAFMRNVEKELQSCLDHFVVADTVKVKTNGYEPVKYRWEGLSPYFEYKVAEKGVSSYLSSVSTMVSGNSYDAWAEDKTLEGGSSIIILNSEANKALAYADGELTEEEVTVKNGVIITPSVLDGDGAVSGQEMPKTRQWQIEKAEKGYYLKNAESQEYLRLEGDSDYKRLAVGKDPYPFTLDIEVGNGLSDDTHRIVYADGRFTAIANNVNDGTVHETDNLRVRIYVKKSIFSEVHRNLIVNTYVPNIVIKKIDSETDDIITKEVGKNGFFTLKRTITDQATGTSAFSYYDGEKWVNSAKGEVSEGQSFELKSGILEFKELPDGEYVLTEITPPDGYQLPDGKELRILFRLEGAKIVVVQEGLPETRNEKPFAETMGDLTLLVRNEMPPVQTAQVKFVKYGTEATGQEPRGGAEFKLYRALTEAEQKLPENDPKKPVIAENVPSDIKELVTDVTDIKGLMPSAEGTGIFFDGKLECGTYYLQEIAPPGGYKPLTGVVKFAIAKENGTSSITVSTNGPKEIVEVEPEKESGEIKKYVVKIFNDRGYELPETGSTGTKPFTFGGAALMISAIAILMYGYGVRRKKSERRLNE